MKGLIPYSWAPRFNCNIGYLNRRMNILQGCCPPTILFHLPHFFLTSVSSKPFFAEKLSGYYIIPKNCSIGRGKNRGTCGFSITYKATIRNGQKTIDFEVFFPGNGSFSLLFQNEDDDKTKVTFCDLSSFQAK